MYLDIIAIIANEFKPDTTFTGSAFMKIIDIKVVQLDNQDRQ